MSIDLLLEVTKLLQKNDIDYWVTGGYALDLAVNRVTREHSNVDFIIRLEDVGKVKELLEENHFSVDFVFDKVQAKKDKSVVNVTTMEEFKGHYLLSTLNIEVSVPKPLMNHVVRGRVEGHYFNRIPNELIYLFMQYSINASDALIAKNLPVNQKSLKSIRVRIKK